MQQSQGRIIAYVRVSTREQAQEGASLEAQEGRIRAWAELNGEGRELLPTFSDKGVSGGRMKRPGLVAALEAACARPGSVLVVYSLSRLARSTLGTLEVAARLEKAGCDLVSMSERIDTTSATGKMVFRLLAVLAEFERDLVSERTRMTMAHKRDVGESTGRYPMLPVSVCARAAALRASGLSLRAIGRQLLAEGVKPMGGGTVWSAKVVRSAVIRGSARAA